MTEERNPYAAPNSKVVSAPAPVPLDDDAMTVAETPSARRAGEGGEWVSVGWQLFKRQPAQLVALVLGTGILYMIGAIALQLIPYIGSIVATVFYVVLLSGLTLAVDRLYRGDGVGFDLLFAGFQHPARVQLAVLGAVAAVLYLLVGYVAALLAGALPFWQASMGLTDVKPEDLIANGSMTMTTLMLYVAYAMALFIPVAMATWFASALVLLNGMQPLAAMGYSFRACLRNLVPLTVQSLLLMLLMLATVFTLFLGMLVVIPLFVLSWYVSYRRICTQPAVTVSA